jgi:hypothetical protein
VSHVRAIASHGALALLEAGIIALLIGILVVAPALAAKGGNGGGQGGGKAAGTISLVVLDGVDATPNHGERVAFEVATDSTDRPFVGVRCWQAGAFVLDGYTGYFDTYMFEPWVWLDSPYWAVGVTADCTARLFHYDKRGNQKVLATVEFAALP